MSSVVETIAPVAEPKKRGERTKHLFSLLCHDWYALIAAIVLIMMISMALFAPWIAPHDPYKMDLLARLAPPIWMSGGNWNHILGTDLLGRDLLTRIMYGARVSIGIGIAVVLAAGMFGTVVGLSAGFVGGRYENAVMRFIDFQSGIPYFLMALTIIAAVGPGIRNLIIVLSIGSWPIFARYSRSLMLTVRNQVFIDAARVSGGSELSIMVRHALPNLVSPLTTLATLELSRVILSEAGLSYLGMGVQPPQPAWGLMVAEGHDYVSTANWIVTFPGLFIMLTTLSINIFATWLRSATDPVQLGRA